MLSFPFNLSYYFMSVLKFYWMPPWTPLNHELLKIFIISPTNVGITSVSNSLQPC